MDASPPDRPQTTLPVRRRVLRTTPGPMPPIATQLGNAAGAIGRIVVAGLRGDPVRVSEQEQARRQAICTAPCEWWTGDRCRACGCVARWKAHLATERCPKDKW